MCLLLKFLLEIIFCGPSCCAFVFCSLLSIAETISNFMTTYCINRSPSSTMCRQRRAAFWLVSWKRTKRSDSALRRTVTKWKRMHSSMTSTGLSLRDVVWNRLLFLQWSVQYLFYNKTHIGPMVCDRNMCLTLWTFVCLPAAFSIKIIAKAFHEDVIKKIKFVNSLNRPYLEHWSSLWSQLDLVFLSDFSKIFLHSF